MRFTLIVMIALVIGFSAAPAFAFGGGGGHHIAVSAPGVATGGSSTTTGQTGSSTVASTSEPLALFAVGLGLLGARFLRRR